MSLAVLSLLASCSRVESFNQKESEPIEFVSYVHPNTKVPLEVTEYRHVDSMRVSAYIADAEDNYKHYIGSFFEDIMFWKNGGGEGWCGVQFWPFYSSVINFSLISQAWKKTNVQVDWGTPAASQAIVRLTDNDVLDQTDLMYGGGKGITDGNGGYSPVSVLFHHALSMVNFSFSSGLYEFVTIKKVELIASYNGTLTVDFDYDNTDASINHSTYSNPSWQPDPVKAMVVPNMKYTGPCDEVVLTQSKVSYGASLMVIPGNTNDRQIRITYTLKQSVPGTEGGDTAEREYEEYVYTHTVAEEWLPGKKYHYSITITPQAILLMPTMEAWPSEIKQTLLFK